MKKNKIITLSIILIVVAGIVGICFLIGIFKIPKLNNNEESDMDRMKKIMETTRPTDVFVLGKEILFETEIKVNNISKLAEEQIKSNKDYKVVIINDLDSAVNLSDEEIEYARELMNKNGYCIIYLGEKYSSTWDRSEQGIANLSGNLSYVYYSWDGQPTRNIGNWLQSDNDELEKYPYMLGQALMYSIEDYLLSGEV